MITLDTVWTARDTTYSFEGITVARCAVEYVTMRGENAPHYVVRFDPKWMSGAKVDSDFRAVVPFYSKDAADFYVLAMANEYRI